MNITNNLNAIRTIANALSDLNLKVVYVGGSVVSLYSNDPAAEDVHETDDLDIKLELASLVELEKIRESLTARGFTQTAANKQTCRFHYEGIIVDVMSTQDVEWAQANPWYDKAFIYLEQKRIDEIKIIILPIAYFLAAKFHAYHDRGRKDPGTSHDFEDIAYVLDNRIDLVEEILNSPADVQKYLKEEFKSIIGNKLMQEAILGNLQYQIQTERLNRIMGKLQRITRAMK
jgi:predicted nucleotidyltransferase